VTCPNGQVGQKVNVDEPCAIKILSVLVLVNHHFLILGEKGGGGVVNSMSGQNFFSQQTIIFFLKDIDDDNDYKDECYTIFLILNKY
jgi:hypothetical protein